MNLHNRLEKLEATIPPNQDANGEAIEHPTAIMLVPFGVTVGEERLKELEAAERERLGKPTGLIFVPYQEETAP